MAKAEAPAVSRETPLGDIMVREVISVQLDDRASMVETLMKRHPIHHIPVVNGKVLQGLISQSDLYRNMLSGAYYDEDDTEQQSFLDNFTEIANIMTRDPFTLTPQDTLGRAVELMLEQRIGCLPLVNEKNELQGIITETDLMRLFHRFLHN